MQKTKGQKIAAFRKMVEKRYNGCPTNSPEYRGGFDEILCYELHSQPINPRMMMKDGCNTGLTFNELAAKWGVSVAFLGDVIADHCMKL